ncbi:MAG: hypothetical protein JW703_04610 [Candidatus Diapherotrites archaeon]|nr:hypothetical protein [Candidatus Diapherotrites archaeon]
MDKLVLGSIALVLVFALLLMGNFTGFLSLSNDSVEKQNSCVKETFMDVIEVQEEVPVTKEVCEVIQGEECRTGFHPWAAFNKFVHQKTGMVEDTWCYENSMPREECRTVTEVETKISFKEVEQTREICQ